MKIGNFQTLYKALYIWFRQKCEDVSVNSSLFQEKAKSRAIVSRHFYSFLYKQWFYMVIF